MSNTLPTAPIAINRGSVAELASNAGLRIAASSFNASFMVTSSDGE